MAWAETLLFKKLVIGFSMKEAVFVEHPGLSHFHLEKKMEASRQEIEKWGIKAGKTSGYNCIQLN